MGASGGRIVGVSIGIVACLVALAVAGALPVAADGHTGPPPANETVEAGEEVSVWQGAPLTFRTDLGTGATSVRNADWRIRTPEGAEPSLNRDPIQVYDAGQDVSLTFHENRVGGSGTFDGESVEVIRARIDASEGASRPESTTGAVELLTGERADATFTSVADADITGSTQTVEDTLGGPGNYVYVVATEADTGFEVTGGDLSVEDPVTIIGLERLSVRKGTGEVAAPSSVSAGETATVDVNASGLEGESLTQSIALYHEDTYTNQQFLIDASGGLEGDADLGDSPVESSLATVNGVATVDGAQPEGSVADVSIGQSVGLGSIVSLVTAGTAEGLTGVEATGDQELDASVTTITQPEPEATISVQTLANWTDGEYRWVYVATGDGAGERYVQTDTLTIGDATDGSDGTNDAGGDDEHDHDHRDDDDDDDDEDEDEEGDNGNVCESAPEPSLTVSDDGVTASVECVEESEVIPIDLNLTASDADHNVTFERVNVTAADGARDVSAHFNTSTSPLENISAGPSDSQTAAYLGVELENMTDAETSNATISFTVSNETLSTLDAEPESIAVSRFHNETWEQVNVTHRNGTRFRAVTPGFSTFAVSAPAPAPALEIAGASIARSEIEVGESVEVSATVGNNGSAAGSTNLSIAVDDDVRTTRNVTVDPGTQVTETLTLAFEEPGSYDVTVGDAPAGAVTVAAASDDGGEATEAVQEERGGGPMLPLLGGVLVVVLVVLGAAVYLRG